MLVNSLVFLESPTLKHIWIFYFYVCVELQLKCVENESYIFFRENVLAANKIWFIVKDFASDIKLLFMFCTGWTLSRSMFALF